MAAVVLFIHGKDITIPKETEVTAFVQGDMNLDMAKFAAIGAPGAPVVVTVAAVEQGSSLSVDASVKNCDIEIDGTFMGNTTSTLTLASGKHEVKVKKVGYADWSRSMMVAPGTVRLNAEMVAQ